MPRLPPRIRAAAALAAALGSACADAPSGPGGATTLAVAFELGPLPTSHETGLVSVVDRVELTVTSGAGVDRQSAPLGADRPRTELEVLVAPGEVRVDARVLSNNDTELYVGSTTAAVDAPGFQLIVDLVPVAPVLVAAPDSLPAPASTPARPFTLENRGAGPLEWWIESAAPALESCGTDPCLRLDPSGGVVAPGRPGTLRVVPVSTPARSYRITVGTEQGEVELVAVAEATGVLEAVVTRASGLPAPGAPVTLLACSQGSQAGSPGSCVPDESVAPRTAVSDDAGVARFPGVRPGWWRLRPDAAGAFSPSQTTLLLEAATTGRAFFRTTIP